MTEIEKLSTDLIEALKAYEIACEEEVRANRADTAARNVRAEAESRVTAARSQLDAFIKKRVRT